jgi:heme/copper-type cytochrome/quinol oxidase subunit 2
MEWYWWVLIVIAVIGIGILKLKVWNNIMAKRKQKKQAHEEDRED